MPLCSLADVKTIVSPETVTDDAINDIIDLVSLQIATGSGASTDTSNPFLKLAVVHESTAIVYERMKVTGEMADKVQFGNSGQWNSADDIIENHRFLSKRYLQMYKSGGYKVPYGRVGVNTVNREVPP